MYMKYMAKIIRFSKNYERIASVENVKMKLLRLREELTQFCTDLLEVIEI